MLIICLLQHRLGSSNWTNVTGGSSVRAISVCGFAAGTRADLFLRAVSDKGYGELAELDGISTQMYSEFEYV